LFVINHLLLPYLGVAGGLYAFNQPLKQYTEDQKTSHNDVRRSSSNQPQPGAASGGASPAPALHTGGSTATSAEAPTIAGASPDARRGNSVDHDVKLRSKSDAKQHDGTGGGGMGVAEMRERKMAGQGLPSPQVSIIDPGQRSPAFPRDRIRLPFAVESLLTMCLTGSPWSYRAEIPSLKSEKLSLLTPSISDRELASKNLQSRDQRTHK